MKNIVISFDNDNQENKKAVLSDILESLLKNNAPAKVLGEDISPVINPAPRLLLPVRDRAPPQICGAMIELMNGASEACPLVKGHKGDHPSRQHLTDIAESYPIGIGKNLGKIRAVIEELRSYAHEGNDNVFYRQRNRAQFCELAHRLECAIKR